MTKRASPLNAPEQLRLNFHVPDKSPIRVDEAAKLIGCSRQQIYLYLADGTLEGVNISRRSALDPESVRRHFRIVTASVANFLEERDSLRTG